MIQLRDYYPTYDELHAIEQAARRAQAEEMRRLAVLGASRLKALVLQFAGASSRAADQTLPSATRNGPGNSRGGETLVSIMEKLGDSLPPRVKVLYAEDLATATRVAGAIDFCIEAWNFTVGVVAGVFHGIAQGLRAGAWFLDLAARRLMLLH